MAPTDSDQSFAEMALELAGKSETEAKATGAVDKADDLVEELFEERFRTSNSPSTGQFGTTMCRRTSSTTRRRTPNPRWRGRL